MCERKEQLRGGRNTCSWFPPRVRFQCLQRQGKEKKRIPNDPWSCHNLMSPGPADIIRNAILCIIFHELSIILLYRDKRARKKCLKRRKCRSKGQKLNEGCILVTKGIVSHLFQQLIFAFGNCFPFNEAFSPNTVSKSEGFGVGAVKLRYTELWR